jgi:hypothetical protein
LPFDEAHEDVPIGIAADEKPRSRRDGPIRHHRALEHDAIAVHGDFRHAAGSTVEEI